MTKYSKKHLFLLIALLLALAITIIGCNQASNSSTSTTKPTQQSTQQLTQQSTQQSTQQTTRQNQQQTPQQPTTCGSCITLGNFSFQKIGQSMGMNQYQLSFVITNNGDATLSNFDVSIKIEARDATTQESLQQTSSSTTPISGHSQFTYQFGNPSVASTSSITFPDPPPSSAHVTVTLTQNTTLVSWDGQVNIPA